MSAITSHHSRVLEGLIARHRERLLQALAEGVKRKTYHQIVGQLQGLDDVLKLSEEADFKLNGDDIVNR